MSKRKVGNIEVTITSKDLDEMLKWLPKYEPHIFSSWGIDYAKEMSEILGIKKDKAEMKVTGTFVNSKIVLDHPVEYVGVFQTTKLTATLRNGNRYEFEVKSMGSSKPEIVGAVKIENKRDTIWQIVLDGSAVETCPNKTRAEMVAVRMMAVNLDEITDFKSAHEKLEKAVSDGQIILYSGNDVFEKLLAMNSEDYALFHVVSSDGKSENHPSNQQEPDGVFVENFYLQSDLIPVLPVFEHAIKAGENFSLMLTGEAGYGKTSAFKAIAQHLNLPHLYVDCSVMLNTTDWFGIMQAKDGNTHFETTEFTKFLEMGNCVIILDEFNRLSIEVANSLLPILDDRGEIRVKNRLIKVGKGILFGITLNSGIEYTGIGGMLDKAIKSRIFGQVEVKPLPFATEIEVLTRNYSLPPETAENIVTIMNKFRDTIKREREQNNFVSADVSTRTSKMVAWWVEKGLDIRQALDYALFNFIGKDEQILLLEAVKVMGIF